MEGNLVIELARKVKAALLDVDGVMTDNTEIVGFEDHVLKRLSYYDGQGISLMRAVGLYVAFVSNKKDAAARAIQTAVDRWNALPSSQSPSNPKGWKHVAFFPGRAGEEKATLMREWLAGIGVAPEDCVVMGDDLVDVHMLKLAGFKVAPAQAEQAIKNLCHFITPRKGGEGAVRDLANLILSSRNIDPLTLPPK